MVTFAVATSVSLKMKQKPSKYSHGLHECFDEEYNFLVLIRMVEGRDSSCMCAQESLPTRRTAHQPKTLIILVQPRRRVRYI